MYRFSLVACAIVFWLAGVCEAEKIASGLYVLSADGPGRAVDRADAEGQVSLGKRFSSVVRREAALVSESNDNSQFRLSLVAPKG